MSTTMSRSVRVDVRQEGGVWIAEASKLPVAAFGGTADEAGARVRQALSVFMTIAAKRGELKRVVTQSGTQETGTTQSSSTFFVPVPGEG